MPAIFRSTASSRSSSGSAPRSCSMSRSARRRWSPRSSRPSPPRCTTGCASRSILTGSISSTAKPRRRSDVDAAHRAGMRRRTRPAAYREEQPMARIQRRRFLQLSGAGGLAASTGGLAGILVSGRAPAYAEGTTLHWLKFVDFVPQSDVLLKGKIKDDCKKALGIDLQIEAINGDGVQARITSAVQSKSGPDILMAVSNWAQLYADSLADVSDIAEARGKAEGGYFETAKDVANDGKRWIAMPFTILGVLLANRTSWFAEEGVTPDKFPATWEEYRAVGKKMKPKGRPFGQTLAHAFGDGPAGWYPYLWSWGGKEVETDGKTVVLNSKETVESVKFAVGMWKDAFDEGGMSWDDAGNNRAFLSNTICSTSNGASIYLLARAKADTYMTEKGKPLKDDC